MEPRGIAVLLSSAQGVTLLCTDVKHQPYTLLRIFLILVALPYFGFVGWVPNKMGTNGNLMKSCFQKVISPRLRSRSENLKNNPDFTGFAMQKMGSFARNKVLFVEVLKMKNCCELMKELFPLKEHSWFWALLKVVNFCSVNSNVCFQNHIVMTALYILAS